MNLFDVVALVDPRPDDALPAGAVGTIVHIFDKPRRAYEVEFVDDDGVTIATATLLPEQIRPA
jgi:Domain of unknown function (DUF4926)